MPALCERISALLPDIVCPLQPYAVCCRCMYNSTSLGLHLQTMLAFLSRNHRLLPRLIRRVMFPNSDMNYARSMCLWLSWKTSCGVTLLPVHPPGRLQWTAAAGHIWVLLYLPLQPMPLTCIHQHFSWPILQRCALVVQIWH